MSSMHDNHPRKKVKSDGTDFKSSGTVNYNVISDKVIEGTRFEREKEFKNKEKEMKEDPATQAQSSSTFDAFRRLAAGLDARTVSEKIADPNRPTWEQYKKDNADKLDMTGADQKKMIQYRAELDRNRELLLSRGSTSKSTAAISDSDDDSDNSSESSGSHERHKRKRKKHSKSHSHSHSHKKRKHEKKEKKHEKKEKRD